MTEESLQNLTIFGLNLITDVLKIANNVLIGEIEAQKGNYELAVENLKAAIHTEDHLIYNEPPGWFFSVRHHLGALFLEMGRYEEAEKVLKEDLVKYPENGWALSGLMVSLEKQNKKEEAENAKTDSKKPGSGPMSNFRGHLLLSILMMYTITSIY